jgi:hypothetical protein
MYRMYGIRATQRSDVSEQLPRALKVLNIRYNGSGLATTGNMISFAHPRALESEIEAAPIRE